MDFSHKFGPVQFLENFYSFEMVNHFLFAKGMSRELNILRGNAISIKPNYIGWFLDANFLADSDMWDFVWPPLHESIKLNPYFNKSYEEIFVNSSFISKKLDKAEKVIKNYVKLKQAYAHPYLSAGLFYSKAMKKQDTASDYFKEAISKEKKSSVSDKKLFYAAADLFKEVNDIDSLSKTYKRIFDIDPFDPVPYFELAKSAYEGGDYKSSQTLMRKAVQADSHFID